MASANAMSLTTGRGVQVAIPDSRPAIPPLPEPLSSHFHAVESGAGYLPSYTNLIQSQALEALTTMQPLLALPSERHLREWLLPIPAAVRNGARGQDETRAWFAAVALACSEVPACLFNRASQMQALQTFEFFPSAADIYRLVADEKAKLARRADILRRIMETPTEG